MGPYVSKVMKNIFFVCVTYSTFVTVYFLHAEKIKCLPPIDCRGEAVKEKLACQHCTSSVED